jgi:hypothetical protein
MRTSMLDEAFGPFGGPLQARTMVSVPKGVQSVHLALDPAGDPIAAWRDDLGVLHAARGWANGSLPNTAPATIVPGNSGAEPGSKFAEGNEFSSDPQGDTAISCPQRTTSSSQADAPTLRSLSTPSSSLSAVLRS